MSDWTESEIAAAWAPRPGSRPIPPLRGKVGDRVRLTAPMRNPGSEILPVESLPVGSEGEIKFINTRCGPDIGWQITVRWDAGSLLDLMPGDRFEVIS